MSDFPKGSIVWARCGKSVYWPAIVYPSEKAANDIDCCVKYLAYNEMTGVVKLNRILHFNGLQQFRENAQLHKAKENMSAKIFNQMYTSTSKMWLRAIAEANVLLLIPVKYRRKFYDQILTVTVKDRRLYLDPLEPAAVPPSASFLKDVCYFSNTFLENKIAHITQTTDFKSAINALLIEYEDREPKVVKPSKKRKSRSVSVYLEKSFEPPKKRDRRSQSVSPSAKYKKPVQGRRKMREDYIINRYSGQRIFQHAELNCHLCYKTGDVVQCHGQDCKLFYHMKCMANNTNNNMLCQNCDAVDIGVKCFVCNGNDVTNGKLICCKSKNCRKYYHDACLKHWPNGIIDKRTLQLQCPQHVCQTCEANSSDPYGANTDADNQLIKCLRCPASYHRHTACIPAGAIFLSDAFLICPRHRRPEKPVNVNWCFGCNNGGGTIFQCDECPGSYHGKCLGFDPEEQETFVCPICQSGKLPLYGEVVWAKLGAFKWWPAVIVPPWLLPDFMLKSSRQNHFCVCFFDKNKSHAWLNKDRSYRFIQENATDLRSSDTKLMEGFREAVEYLKIVKTTLPAYKMPQRKIKQRKYKQIECNVIVAPAKLPTPSDVPSRCYCKMNEDNPCAPGGGCINEIMAYECNNKCPAGNQCQNKRFQNRLYANVEQRETANKGIGLFANENILPGQFIIEYVGEIINMEEFHQRYEKMVKENSLAFYFIWIDKSLVIDATFRGNNARFINHSCEPNCTPQKWLVNGETRIGFFASKEISANAEISFNYDWSKIPGKNQQSGTPCYCGSLLCAGFIGAKPKPIGKLRARAAITVTRQ